VGLNREAGGGIQGVEGKVHKRTSVSSIGLR